MKGRRFLISKGVWALPGPRWRIVKGNPLLTSGRSVPKQIVKRKRGPIPNLGPIIAATMVQTLADRCLPHPEGAASAVRDLPGILLNREVRAIESAGWRKSLLQRRPDPETAGIKNPPADLCEALCYRWCRSYEIAMDRGGWNGLLREIGSAPERVFDYAADLNVISSLYEIDWGAKEPRRWIGAPQEPGAKRDLAHVPRSIES